MKKFDAEFIFSLAHEIAVLVDSKLWYECRTEISVKSLKSIQYLIERELLNAEASDANRLPGFKPSEGAPAKEFSKGFAKTAFFPMEDNQPTKDTFEFIPNSEFKFTFPPESVIEHKIEPFEFIPENASSYPYPGVHTDQYIDAQPIPFIRAETGEMGFFRAAHPDLGVPSDLLQFGQVSPDEPNLASGYANNVDNAMQDKVTMTMNSSCPKGGKHDPNEMIFTTYCKKCDSNLK